MKNLIRLVFVLISFHTLPVFAEQSAQFLKTYSRGDDDSDYSYKTATVTTALNLKQVAAGYDAQISFTAKLTTAEAQGFAESVRFGMREVERFVAPPSTEPKSVAVTTQPVVFKFVQPDGARPDTATQRSADSLSEQFSRTGIAIPGNRPEAMGKTLAGTLALGTLSEGEHRGTLFVQQLVAQAPSATDTDISVRHLIRWHAKIHNGRVYVEIQNGKYFASDAGVEIAAPSWDGTVKPHRLALRGDQVVLDGQTFPSGTARYGAEFPDKGATLLNTDKAEFRGEYNWRERMQIWRQNRR